jgi:hypothetical protein
MRVMHLYIAKLERVDRKRKIERLKRLALLAAHRSNTRHKGRSDIGKQHLVAHRYRNA